MEDGQIVRIGGIKFSEELVQVTVACTSSDYSLSICRLLQQLAYKNINIPFLCHSVANKNPESSFCVHRSELGRIQQLLVLLSLQDEHVDIIPSVGTLTVFPHRNSFKLLGLLIHFFGRHGFPIHSLGTSISAIALNTDYILLDEIAEKLQNVLELPENHAPFRPGFRLTQIQQ
jgi:aspartokinase